MAARLVVITDGGIPVTAATGDCPETAILLPGGGHESWLWHTFRGADVARVASGIGVIWVIMVGM